MLLQTLCKKNLTGKKKKKFSMKSGLTHAQKFVQKFLIYKLLKNKINK